MNGIIGGVSCSTISLYRRWFLDGSIADSKSENIFLNLFGNFSQVWDKRLTATLLKPIIMAKKEYKF